MKTTVRMSLQLLIGAAATTATLPAMAAYTATAFDIPGATRTDLWDITNTGQLVGNTNLGGFVYSGGVANFLPTYLGLTPSALGVSDSGIVVGSVTDPNGNATGFLYEAGTYTPVAVAGANFTQVRHISADGRYATGYYAGVSLGGGFVLDRNTSVLTLVPVDPGTTFMILQGANSSGLVTGSVTSNVPADRGGVLYDANTAVTTFYPTAAGLPNPRFRDITDAGLIAGWIGTVSLVGTVANGFETFSVAGAANTTAQGINEAGVVVGSYTDANGNTHGFIASVPEPTSALLLVAGLAWVAMRWRALR